MPLSDDWALWRVAAVRSAGMPVDWLEALAETRDGDAGSIAALVSEPRFAAALTWQNPNMVATWLGPLIAAAGTESAVGKINSYRAVMLARYAQRYCAKNESIGFFGPVGWARLTEDDQELAVTGSAGIRHGDVFLEHWAVELIARTFEADERVRPHLPVRRHPAVSIEGRLARRPWRSAVQLDDEDLGILEQAANGLPAGQIEPQEALRALTAAGIVRIGFTVPLGERPHDGLAAQIERITDLALRTELLRWFDELEQSRLAAAKVIADPVPLREALAELEQAFSALTGASARREKPSTAAGRTLAYPDCRRDLDVRIGWPLVERLRAPLALLLDIARWFTQQVAEEVAAALSGIYDQLSRRDGQVTLADLHFAAADVLSGGPHNPVPGVIKDFQLRWAEIVGPGTDAEEVRLDSAEIAGLVEALYPAAGDRPAWTAALQHSPDLLLARTPSGLRWVLGELHLAMNTLESRFFHTLSDDRSELEAATAADMAGGRIVPCYPHGPVVDSRRYPPLAVHLPDRYLYWSFGDDVGAPDGAESIPATALVVEAASNGLVAGPRDGAWRLPVLEFFGEFLSALAVSQFRMSGDGRYEARVSIDDLVVRRRGWYFTAADLPGGVISRRGYHWRVLADHLAAAGLPRYLFAKSPLEPKPFFVDVRSPLLVTNLARSWRRMPEHERLEIREMLPGPEELWLTDSSGQRYTAELRLVAVDRRGGTGPQIAPVVRSRAAASATVASQPGAAS
jgi:Lantibiotic dehydratase, N terminus